MRIEEIINNLNILDLSKEPYSEVESLVSELCQYYNLTIPLHSGMVIIRARPNETINHYNSKCDLTYPPKFKCNKCNRANIPNEQMFYACTFENSDIPKSLFATAVESNYTFLNDKKITFSYWRISKEINLVAVLPDKNLDKLSPAAKLLQEYFFNKLSQVVPVESMNNSIIISNYFSSVFSKPAIESYEYIVSAEFTKYLVDRGFNGILYPSVEMKGEVLNIAISPEIADSNLELVAVREYKSQQVVNRCVLNLEYYVDLKPDQTHFELLPYLILNT